MKNKKKILSVFDFDGTLTYHDSFFSFLYFSFGKRQFFNCLMRMIKLVLRHKCYKFTRDDLKGILVKAFFTNIEEKWLRKKASSFCEQYWKKLMRPSGVLAVEKETNSGAEVTLCSASPTLILQPFANKLGVKVIGTQLEIKNGRTTGRIAGHNCRCAQKVIQLKNVYGDLTIYHIRVWGNTRGDHELLSIAQEPHWKFFS